MVAARDLAGETGSAAFTVAQVAGRAGVSLKVFYRYFAGKDDLLVALLEEDSRIGAQLLQERVDAHADPIERLRAAVTGLLELITLEGALGYAGVLIREHRRLSESRPEELAQALAPIVDVLALAIAGTVDAGVSDARAPRRAARTLFALVLDTIHEVVLGRADALEEATFLWQICWSGVRGDAASRRSSQPVEDR